MPRFLLFSDVHLHPWNSITLEHQRDCLLNIVRYAVNNNIKNLLFSGDIFHSPSNINTQAMWVWNKFLSEVKRANLSLTGISGNHDHYFKDGSVTALEAVNLLPKGRLLYSGDITTIDGVPVKGFDYIDDKEELKSFLKDSDFPSESILLTHQGVNGIELNSKGFTLNEALHPDLIPQNVLHCFSGHYHSNKQVSDNLTIPGALIQHGFGDSSEARGFLDITVNRGINISRVYNMNTLTSDLNIEFEKVGFNQVVDCISTDRSFKSDALNLKITDVPSEKEFFSIKENIRLLPGQSLSVEYITQTATSPEVIKSESFSTVDFFEYYVKSRALSPEQIKIGKELIYG